MKKLIAIIAVLGILLHTFNQVVIVAQFYANQDYIAKNLCENRARPEKKCCGKCYLGKQLNKADDSKGNRNTASKLVLEEVTSFVLPQLITLSFIPVSEIKSLLFNKESSILNRPPGAIFHPPAC